MKKADFAGAAFAAFLFLISLFFIRGGDTAAIYIDGRLYKSVPLSSDITIPVKSEYGENTVCVKNKSVYIINSNCPGGQCMHGKIVSRGQSLVCLPHRLSVVIENNSRKNETDVIL